MLPLKPLVSVVIPSWNGARILRSTLVKLVETEGVAFEVLVVDHGRLNRETEALLKEYAHIPHLRYVGLDHQLGFAGAVNHGVSLSQAEFVAVICNDVLVEKNWLRDLVRAAEKERAQGRHPVLYPEVRHGGKFLRGRRMNFWFRIVADESPAGHLFPDGSAFLFPRAVYGLPFDADYFLYQEDVYLGWRAWLRGEAVVMVPGAVVDNFDGGTTRRTKSLTTYYSERNRWLNYFSFLSWGTLLRALPPLWLDASIKFVLGTNRLAKLRAWAWVVVFFPTVLRKRAKVQAERVRADEAVLPLLSRLYLDAPATHPLNRLVCALVRLLRLPLGP